METKTLSNPSSKVARTECVMELPEQHENVTIMTEEQQKKMMARIQKQRARHKRYYNRKKKQANEVIKSKFLKIYENLELLGANKNIDNLDNYANNLGVNKFKCKCFDLLFDVNASIYPILDLYDDENIDE